MKYLRLLALALVFCPASIAEQTVKVAGVPFDVILPNGWVSIPDKGMDHLQPHIPGFVIDVLAGFVAPRPASPSAVVVLVVEQIVNPVTPQRYLDYNRGSLAEDQAQDPGVKMFQDSCQVGINDHAVITSFHDSDGRAWRTYGFPTAEGIFLFTVLVGPAANAPAAYAAIEPCLARIHIVAGAPFDAKWIAEMKKIMPATPKRVY